jgi:hypothetical protein
MPTARLTALQQRALSHWRLFTTEGQLFGDDAFTRPCQWVKKPTLRPGNDVYSAR